MAVKSNRKMKTTVHLVASAILAAALYPVFGWKAVFILAGGVLIDVDHYLWYVCKYKKFSLFGCYNHFIVQMESNHQKENMGILIAFHTIEFLLIAGILSFYSQYALVFTIGLLAHYLLDLIYLYAVPKRFIANHSVIYWIYKNKIQKV